MIECGNRARLTLEAGEAVRIPGDSVRQHLECDVPVEA